ncbi:transcription factor HES-1-like [Latimeria chalumnae]|uniref:transcription factor HES-1-like n=1 Tax=Latimeria chalumnae TaxID=7897 RepID=UPI0003C178B8|nr:PREDICTED: transcription factor HES-1-like [Latimeria chalumnae]|eukprot:XP_006011219.1 PREDICTED: transcription factor HES-1-like [Latimeria chalumnae]
MLDYKNQNGKGNGRSSREPSAENIETAREQRKMSKPIMEKRRRARINESLSQLRFLILDTVKKESPRYSKLEKADILEMTVKYLRMVQHDHITAALSIDPSILSKFRAGFNECANEVTRFLSKCEGIQVEVRSRLLNHLATCVSALSCPPTSPASRPSLQVLVPTAPSPETNVSASNQNIHSPPPTHFVMPPIPLHSLNTTNMTQKVCSLQPLQLLPPTISTQNSTDPTAATNSQLDFSAVQFLPVPEGQFATFLVTGPTFSSTGQFPGREASPPTANSKGNSVALPRKAPGVSSSMENSEEPAATCRAHPDNPVWRPW